MSAYRFAQASVLCIAVLAAPLAVSAQSVARPDLKAGDTWTVGITANAGFGASAHREEVRVVKEAGDTGYLVENTKKEGGGAAPVVEMLHISRDLNFIGRSTGAPQEFKWLQWPLEPGRSYEFETAAGNATATWKGKVVGWEDIEVPAGKFRALHVEFDRSGPFRAASSESLWFAPEAKTVVKRIQTRPGGERSKDVTTTELLSYKLN